MHTYQQRAGSERSHVPAACGKTQTNVPAACAFQKKIAESFAPARTAHTGHLRTAHTGHLRAAHTGHLRGQEAIKDLHMLAPLSCSTELTFLPHSCVAVPCLDPVCLGPVLLRPVSLDPVRLGFVCLDPVLLRPIYSTQLLCLH